jgi:hypothetical protein
MVPDSANHGQKIRPRLRKEARFKDDSILGLLDLIVLARRS